MKETNQEVTKSAYIVVKNLHVQEYLNKRHVLMQANKYI